MKTNRLAFVLNPVVAPLFLAAGVITAAFTPAIVRAAPLATVANLNDSGPGSLRQAIADVDPGGTVNFGVSGTIVLANELPIDKELTINGGNAVTISGNNAVRVFNIGSNGQVTLVHLRIVQGHAVGGMGGGISSAGALTLINSTLSDNRANGGGGGGIHATGPLTIINTTVANNSDYGGTTAGGGGVLNYGPTTIRNTVISGNYTAGFGGGISNRGNTTIENSTIADNRALQGGGGLASSNVSLGITRSTIVDNTAESSFFGGGGMLVNVPGSTTSMGHTILANNSHGNCKGTVDSLGHNLIDVTTSCTITGDTTGNITGQSPGLGPLQDNGGPTSSYKPNNGSPAINAGAADCGATVDQRGATRPHDGNCDIGAVEVREMLTTSSCGAGDLSGAQQFDFASGNSVVVTVGTANGLNCISVEEMGGDHLAATGSPGDAGIGTGNWWHISGNITAGFSVTVALPHANLSDPEVCKYPGTQAGLGWGCFRTGFDSGAVWLDGVDGFSDWAVGNEVPESSYLIGGTVAGLAGTGLVLQNNGGDDLPVAGDGSFTFPTALLDGSDYAVTVLTQPNSPSQTCTVASGEGALAGANVANVQVACATDTYVVTTTAINGAITSTIDPVVEHGQSTTVNGVADADHYLVSVSGCGGTPQSNNDPSIINFSYETGPITAACSVQASFERIATDLQVAKESGGAAALDGQLLVYSITVANAGPLPAMGAQLVDELPAELVDGEWACIPGESNTACPSSPYDAGEGDLFALIDLPAGRFLRYDLSARVQAGSGATVSNTASIAPPAGLSELDAGNNSATAEVLIVPQGIFANGFEALPTPLTVDEAAKAQREARTR